jgi:hypothetical protein
MHLSQLTEAGGWVDANQPLLKSGCRDSVVDPVSGTGAFWLLEPDPGWKISGSRMKILYHIFEILAKLLWVKHI